MFFCLFFNTFAVPLPYDIIIKRNRFTVYINNFRNMLVFYECLISACSSFGKWIVTVVPLPTSLSIQTAYSAP